MKQKEDNQNVERVPRGVVLHKLKFGSFGSQQMARK